MRITVDAQSFIKAFEIAKACISSKGPVGLSQVQVTAERGITLAATDLDTTIEVDLERGFIDGFGVGFLPANLPALLKRHKGEVVLSYEHDGKATRGKLRVQYGTRERVLEVVHDPLPVPAGDWQEVAAADGGELAAALKAVLPAAAKDDSRPVLRRVHLDCRRHRVRLTAADGFLMGRMSVPASIRQDGAHLITPEAAALVAKLAPADRAVEIMAEAQDLIYHVKFDLGRVRVYSRALQEKAPDYDAVYERAYGSDVRVRVDRQDLLDAIADAAAGLSASRKDYLALALVPASSGLMVYTRSEETGTFRAWIDGRVDSGRDGTVAIISRIALVVAQAGGEELWLSWRHEDRKGHPILIQGLGEWVLMPAYNDGLLAEAYEALQAAA